MAPMAAKMIQPAAPITGRPADLGICGAAASQAFTSHQG
jgi:hypothetical protein